MSLYREVRDLIEMLKVLKYHRHTCVEHFRQPNFKLVVDILLWLTGKFEPFLTNQDDVIQAPENSEASRLVFLRNIVRFFAKHAQVLLNSKKLYKADFEAAVELKKITLKVKQSIENAGKDYGPISKPHLDIKNDPRRDASNLLEEFLQQASQTLNTINFAQLANELMENTNSLGESLQMELQNVSKRASIIERRLELNEADRVMKSQKNDLQQLNSDLDKWIKNVNTDLGDMNAKLERRQSEVQHALERLETLQLTTPSYKEKLDELIIELDQIYENYVQRFRCLSYLEHELEICSDSNKTNSGTSNLKSSRGLSLDDEDYGGDDKSPSITRSRLHNETSSVTDEIQKSINDVIESKRKDVSLDGHASSNEGSMDSDLMNDDDNAADNYDDEEGDDDDVLDLNTDEEKELMSLFN